MTIGKLINMTVVATLIAGAAQAADYSDPTWPCIQRKVDTLSLGIMWPHPVPEQSIPDDIAKEANELIETLALRRVSLAEAEGYVAAFKEQHQGLTVGNAGLIFAEVFDLIQHDRTQIIEGIARYSLKQIALSESIDVTRLSMSTQMAKEEPDFDEVDRLEEKLDWDERIYRDRAQSLTYVCETPILLEKRLYAIAQMLLKYVE